MITRKSPMSTVNASCPVICIDVVQEPRVKKYSGALG
jgi:hypothetical protein